MSHIFTELVDETTADTLLGLARALGEEDGHPLQADGEAAVRALAAGDPCARAWLLRAEAGGPVIGYAVVTLGFSIEHGGRDGFIDELYVVPEARGCGIGEQALSFATNEAREMGVVTLHLEVERTNFTAERLYCKHGFRANGRLLMSKRI